MKFNINNIVTNYTDDDFIPQSAHTPYFNTESPDGRMKISVNKKQVGNKKVKQEEIPSVFNFNFIDDNDNDNSKLKNNNIKKRSSLSSLRRPSSSTLRRTKSSITIRPQSALPRINNNLQRKSLELKEKEEKKEWNNSTSCCIIILF